MFIVAGLSLGWALPSSSVRSCNPSFPSSPTSPTSCSHGSLVHARLAFAPLCVAPRYMSRHRLGVNRTNLRLRAPSGMSLLLFVDGLLYYFMPLAWAVPLASLMLHATLVGWLNTEVRLRSASMLLRRTTPKQRAELSRTVYVVAETELGRGRCGVHGVGGPRFLARRTHPMAAGRLSRHRALCRLHRRTRCLPHQDASSRCTSAYHRWIPMVHHLCWL